jgi:dihydroneopterin aldolase
MNAQKLPKGAIGFEGLTISCIIGILPQERTTLQDLVVDLKVCFDTSPEALNDDSSPRIDYTVLAEICVREAQNGRYQLIETLAARILNLVAAKFDLKWAWIRLRKPGAIAGATAAVLELEREFVKDAL